MTRRHASGTWRRTCGTIRRPPASPAAAASSSAAAIATAAPRPAPSACAEQREAAERRDAAGQRAGGERRAGDDRRAHPLRVAVRRERVDHREPARRPGPGQAGDQRGGGERDQHGTFVWKYMTQNTRRLA